MNPVIDLGVAFNSFTFKNVWLEILAFFYNLLDLFYCMLIQ